MSTINYKFLENELLDEMLKNLKHEELNKEIICEQIAILAIFNIINAEQVRQLSYFKYYKDYRCYATYFYDTQNKYHATKIIAERSKIIADELIKLEIQENHTDRTSFTEDSFKASSPVNQDRSNDESILISLSFSLLHSSEEYFISKEFIDDNCIISRKKAINTTRRKLLDTILQVNPPRISNRAYSHSLKSFEYHFAQNDNVVDNIKLFLYRSAETCMYQSFIDIITSDGIEDTEFNRAKLQEMIQVLVVLRRINTDQAIQLCAKSLDKPDCLPISMLSIKASMDISLNIDLEISNIKDQERNENFSLENFEAAAHKKITEPHDLDFYEFAFHLLEMHFYLILDILQEFQDPFDLVAYHRLLTLLQARKLSIKNYVELKLEFGF